jgi:mannose-6-phosphate isomerase-like protein (cupin superfamily)
VSGEASLVVGGAIPNAKSVGPGESRGPAIVGGARHEMRPGDIAHIPANTPHQFLVPRSFTYYVVKVNAR